MNIFKILIAITLILKFSSAAKESSRRYKLLQFTLPKHKHSIRIFLMLQEPWHLNVLRDLDALIDNDNEEYSPVYDIYREAIENFLEAFNIYAKDQSNCGKAEHLIETIGKTRELLFATEDDKFRKILDKNNIDTLDVYEHYTMEFYERFAQEFQHYENSLSKEEEEKEHNLINWFDDFIKEMDFMEKTEKFGRFFQFFEDELKYDTSVCSCLL